jgi:hypothetical protein
MTDNLSSIRDPLFVIEASLEIIKHHSTNESIALEVKRIENALEKISRIIN